jgi:site-specific DNA-methyltransferase (adenine-specific)
MKDIKDFENRIICGDCLEIMGDLPDKSIDLILTDPPYQKSKADKRGITHGYGSSSSKKFSGDWDIRPSQEVFNEIFRVSKNQIIFGGNYFNLPISNCWLVWDKKGDIKFNNPFADCELIWTSFRSVIKKYTFKQQGFIRDSKDVIVHPTQKPTELITAILADYSKNTDMVCDPFVGSGSTALACINTNRRYIGIEKNPDYCAIAEQRLANIPERLDSYESDLSK